MIRAIIQCNGARNFIVTSVSSNASLYQPLSLSRVEVDRAEKREGDLYIGLPPSSRVFLWMDHAFENQVEPVDKLPNYIYSSLSVYSMVLQLIPKEYSLQ